MELNKNQYVVFENGHKEGYLEARWSDKFNAFYSYTDDNRRIYSNNVITVQSKKSNRSKKSGPMKEIFPSFETEKAYAVIDGDNGMVSRGNTKTFYKFYAKSICTIKNGKIFAPIWA